MNCPRCQGLMVIDLCMDLESGPQSIWVKEWRCLNCGELFDKFTMDNRKLSKSGALRSTSPRHERKTGVSLSS